MGALDVMRFKVLYKLPGSKKPVTCDFVMDDLKGLLKHLATEGVTKENVDYMYVHYLTSSGETMEIVSVENTVQTSVPQSNVIDLSQVRHIKRAADSKPRIRAVIPPLEVVHQGMYSAIIDRG